jgi:hypothetical protein
MDGSGAGSLGKGSTAPWLHGCSSVWTAVARAALFTIRFAHTCCMRSSVLIYMPQVGQALYAAAGRLGLPVGFMTFKGLLLHIAGACNSHAHAPCMQPGLAAMHACCMPLQALCPPQTYFSCHLSCICRDEHKAAHAPWLYASLPLRADIESLIAAHPEVNVIMDHFAFCKCDDLSSQEWAALLKLARHPQVMGGLPRAVHPHVQAGHQGHSPRCRLVLLGPSMAAHGGHSCTA